jgi:magnesium transporter
MEEIRDQFQQLINDRSWLKLKIELNNLESFQIADVIESLPKKEQVVLFRVLSRQSAKNVFEHLSLDEQQSIIEGMADNVSQLSELLNDLSPDDRTAFFEELPGAISQRLMQMLSREEREITLKLLGYPKESIGRLMTPEYVAVKPFFTVSQALEHIRKFGRDSETLNVI